GEGVERELLHPVSAVARDPGAVNAPQLGARPRFAGARVRDEGGVLFAGAVEDAEREDAPSTRAHAREGRRGDELARSLEPRVGEDERPARGELDSRRAVEEALEAGAAQPIALAGV